MIIESVNYNSWGLWLMQQQRSDKKEQWWAGFWRPRKVRHGKRYWSILKTNMTRILRHRRERVNLYRDDIISIIDQNNQSVGNICKYTICPSNAIFDLIMAAILDFKGSIWVKFKFWPQKWNPWPKKWYITCITQWYSLKSAKTKISPFPGGSRFLTTPKMT